MRPCIEPGCKALVQRGRCQAHQRDERSNSRSPEAWQRKDFYSSRPWRKRRIMFLRRNPLCAICQSPASDVDHIVPRADGGGDDDENLQPLCHSCHSRKTATESMGYNGMITVVWGAPASGKSTYVREHMADGDLVLDYDAIYMALSQGPIYHRPQQLHEYVMAAFNAVLDALADRPTKAWVIVAWPKRASVLALCRRLGARLHYIAETMQVCAKRIAADPARWEQKHGMLSALKEWVQSV